MRSVNSATYFKLGIVNPLSLDTMIYSDYSHRYGEIILNSAYNIKKE